MTTSKAMLEQALDEHMKLPQRHRLLHGFPLHHSMSRIERTLPEQQHSLKEKTKFHNVSGRGLLVGILPHPLCNPRVPGCGFCTFPHEPYRASLARHLVHEVIREIHRRKALNQDLVERPVVGLYIGGGTANLTPSDALEDLALVIDRTFDISQTEVTIEGVPAYFLKRYPPLELLQRNLNARHFRVSMGIQTFIPEQLKRMGRERFGNEQTFREVRSHTHSLGATISADLLFNLPYQSQQEMVADVDKAIELGLDQICLYNLVLFRNLGTEWSNDLDLLKAIPQNEQACENWLVLQSRLIKAGFIQTSLTNFEKQALHKTPNRFIYEENSYHPNRYDMLGFGPSAISFSSDSAFKTGWKTTNPTSSKKYSEALGRSELPWDRFHLFDKQELRLFYLIRRLAACKIERKEYRELFGSAGPVTDYPELFHLLLDRDLLGRFEGCLCPTPKGVFYADAMASLLVYVSNENHEHKDINQKLNDEPHVASHYEYNPVDESNIVGDM